MMLWSLLLVLVVVQVAHVHAEEEYVKDEDPEDCNILDYANDANCERINSGANQCSAACGLGQSDEVYRCGGEVRNCKRFCVKDNDYHPCPGDKPAVESDDEDAEVEKLKQEAKDKYDIEHPATRSATIIIPVVVIHVQGTACNPQKCKGFMYITFTAYIFGFPYGSLTIKRHCCCELCAGGPGPAPPLTCKNIQAFMTPIDWYFGCP